MLEIDDKINRMIEHSLSIAFDPQCLFSSCAIENRLSEGSHRTYRYEYRSAEQINDFQVDCALLYERMLKLGYEFILRTEWMPDGKTRLLCGFRVTPKVRVEITFLSFPVLTRKKR